MPTRNVVITEEQEEFIQALVANGRYQNASEVLREGLRLVLDLEEERVYLEEAQEARARALLDAARIGSDQIDRGESYAFSSREELREFIAEIGREVEREFEQ